MERDHTSFLQDWLHSDGRKPLIIRGARQVGKTWLIRDLAHREQRCLIEINFEKQPEFKSLFSSNNPNEILLNIAAAGEGKVDPSKSILFLDEIQAAPELLGKLRWFYEDLPEMPVVAAGSLLEFALAKHSFSMPVGRISFMYLEPLSFEEFLDAMGHYELRTYVRNYDWKTAIPEAIHGQLMKLVKEYLLVGGMPATAACWAKERDIGAVHQIHVDLLTTYRDDFSKTRRQHHRDRRPHPPSTALCGSRPPRRHPYNRCARSHHHHSCFGIHGGKNPPHFDLSCHPGGVLFAPQSSRHAHPQRRGSGLPHRHVCRDVSLRLRNRQPDLHGDDHRHRLRG